MFILIEKIFIEKKNLVFKNIWKFSIEVIYKNKYLILY
jgi:hypothetical protein